MLAGLSEALGLRRRNVPTSQNKDTHFIIVNIENTERESILRRADTCVGKIKTFVLAHPAFSTLAALTLLSGSVYGVGLMAVAAASKAVANRTGNASMSVTNDLTVATTTMLTRSTSLEPKSSLSPETLEKIRFIERREKKLLEKMSEVSQYHDKHIQTGDEYDPHLKLVDSYTLQRLRMIVVKQQIKYPEPSNVERNNTENTSETAHEG